MGFKLNVAKGLIAAATKFGTPDGAAGRIRAICDTIDFTMYDEQRYFATLAVKTLIGLRDTAAMDVLTLLASNDISYAEAAIAEIKKTGSNDYARILAEVGVSFSSLRDDAWNLMIERRGPHLGYAAEWISNKGETYHTPIMQKLLSEGSWAAIEAACEVFYLRPELSIALAQEVLAGKKDTVSIDKDTLCDFFEEVSNPAMLRPFVTYAYQRAYAHAAVQHFSFNDRMQECRMLIDPVQHLGTVDKLRDLFGAADRSGVLESGINLSHILTAVVVQAEEQFAPEILHYTMHNPAP